MKYYLYTNYTSKSKDFAGKMTSRHEVTALNVSRIFMLQLTEVELGYFMYCLVVYFPLCCILYAYCRFFLKMLFCKVKFAVTSLNFTQ